MARLLLTMHKEFDHSENRVIEIEDGQRLGLGINRT